MCLCNCVCVTVCVCVCNNVRHTLCLHLVRVCLCIITVFAWIYYHRVAGATEHRDRWITRKRARLEEGGVSKV